MIGRSLKVLAILGLVALVVAVGGGCRGAGPGAPGASAGSSEAEASISGVLNIFIPCGVAGPYGETLKAFATKYPNVQVKQQMANIDVQAKLLADGKATPDLWLALGDREVARIAKLGRIEGKPVTFAYNSIAFMVHRGNPLGIASVQDLLKPGVKTLAMASPENSSGYYGEQALRKAGVWDKIQNKLWVTDQPALIKGQLSAGKAEVGIVYYPCAREAKIMGGEPQELPGKLQLLNKLPEELSGVFPAQAVVIKGAANPQAARAFMAFLMSDAVQDIWEKWAFDRAKQPASGNRVVLYMYCGAGIRPMMDEAVSAFKNIQPNVRIDVGYAGSGCLLSQLTFGKRGDLYVPGEDFYLKQAADRGFITSQQPVGFFEPVLLVAKGNPKGIKTVADLARPGLKVAVGEPQACAVGLAAEALLKKAGMLEKVSKNIVLRAGNVPELGNAVKLRAVDVAVVWNVTAAQQTEDCDSIAVSPDLYTPSQVSVGLLQFSKHQAEAKAFSDFLASSQGQEIVKRSGMTLAAEGKKPAGS